MGQLDPLLVAVCANPEDVAARRAFAAAVKATDPERSRFIEAQLEHRAARRRGEDPDTSEAKGLLARNQARWVDPKLDALVKNVAFYGGFVENIHIDAPKLVANSRQLARLAPIRHVRVRHLKDQLDRFTSLELLAQIVSLDAGACQLDNADVARLVAAKMPRLKLLVIANNPAVDLDGLRAIARADLPALRYVDADQTEAPLVVRTSDWDGSIPEVDWTSARATLVDEVGHKPWLDEMHLPELEAL